MTTTLTPPNGLDEASPPAPGAPPAGPASGDRRGRRNAGGSRLRRVWRGPDTDPAWARPALWALLAVTAALYLWNLGASGWANTYYAAAVQAGTKSWKAFFFGSTDASNFITVDKTPLSLWPMELSARIFGLNSWSMLVPQALMGVATVGVLYATVKRWFGAGAGLLAGAICALTPVAALMFRFNNPDASLTLLMTLGAYALTRALERDSTKWVVAAGAFVGLAFLSKELQAFLVLPAFGLAYLIAGPPKLARRIWHTILIGLSTIVAAGWWIAIVYAWPASSRPYLGGSQDNTFFDVLFGYNGFGRLSGNETGSVGGGGGTGGQWGPTGLDPPLQLAVRRRGVVAAAGRADLLDRRVVLDVAPACGPTGPAPPWCCGAAGCSSPARPSAWARASSTPITRSRSPRRSARSSRSARCSCGASASTPAPAPSSAPRVGATAIWSAILLDRTPDWTPWLHDVVLILGGIAALALLFPIVNRRVAALVAGTAIVVGLAAPAAYTLSTVRQSHTGAIPSAGPAGAGGGFGPGGGGGRVPRRRTRPAAFPGATTNGGTQTLPGGQHRWHPGWSRRRYRRAAGRHVGAATRSRSSSRTARTATAGRPPRSAPTTRPATSSPRARR